jgi:hypothetical protein
VSRITLSAPVSHSGGGIQYPVAPSASAQGTAWSAATGVGYVNNGQMYLWCWNSSGSAVTATVNFGRKVEGQTVTPLTASIPAGAATALGPYSPSDFTALDGSGLTYVDFSVVTGLYVALYQLVPVS